MVNHSSISTLSKKIQEVTICIDVIVIITSVKQSHPYTHKHVIHRIYHLVSKF